MILKSMAAAFLDGNDEDDQKYLETPKILPGCDPDNIIYEGGHTEHKATSPVRTGMDNKHTAVFVKKLISRRGDSDDADIAYDTLMQSEQHREVSTPNGTIRVFSSDYIWEVIKTCPSMMDYIGRRGFESYEDVLAWETKKAEII